MRCRCGVKEEHDDEDLHTIHQVQHRAENDIERSEDEPLGSGLCRAGFGVGFGVLLSPCGVGLVTELAK